MLLRKLYCKGVGMFYQKLIIRLLVRIVHILYITAGKEELLEDDVIILDARKFLKDSKG